jgi:glutathione S-transferase
MLRLVSHHLCPYVQRATIVAAEKGLEIERKFIDLANKPSWFLALSPTGKVPLLEVGDGSGQKHILFESAAIAEYLDEVGPLPSLMPSDPIQRAKTRAWMDFASGTLAEIAGLYSAEDEGGFSERQARLAHRFAQLTSAYVGPWFMGHSFGLVDAAFGPVFRYFDVLETSGILVIETSPEVAAWRTELARRSSVVEAVDADYPERLRAFFLARSSHLASMIKAAQ